MDTKKGTPESAPLLNEKQSKDSEKFYQTADFYLIISIVLIIIYLILML